MALQQALMGRGEEWEPRHKVLVVRFDAPGETGPRITGDDQADQDAVHIDLVPVGRGPATEAPAIGELRIDGRVDGDHVTRGAIGDRDRPPQVDGTDDVEAGPLGGGDGSGTAAQGLVDAHGLGVSHKDRIQDVGPEPGHIFERIGVQVESLPLRSNETGIEERQRISAHLYVVAGPAKAGNDVARVHGLRALAADRSPYTEQAVGRGLQLHAVVWDSAGKEIADRDFQCDRGDVETGEDIFDRRVPRSWKASQVAAAQVDEVE